MAYPECPDCRTPQLVPDGTAEYQCFTCYADVRVHACPHCEYRQTIARRWVSFTCGKCGRKVDPPASVPFSEALHASQADGVGYMYPKL